MRFFDIYKLNKLLGIVADMQCFNSDYNDELSDTLKECLDDELSEIDLEEVCAAVKYTDFLKRMEHFR